MRNFIAERAASVQESVIREMTRLADRHNAINLSQGLPDFNPPEFLVQAAVSAVKEGFNQYSYTWGRKGLREAVARFYERRAGISFDPETEVVITCGASEAIVASILAVVEPEDEVIVIEPFYENYVPAVRMAGGRPVFVSLEPDGDRWILDIEKLRSAFSPRTKALILNTPHNPTGKCFSPEELSAIAELLSEHNAVLITDETYEFITYEKEHVLPISIDGLLERTITVSTFSKTFAATGWRVGYALAREKLLSGVRRMHDYLTICAPTPFQRAFEQVLDSIDHAYFKSVADAYRAKRDVIVDGLKKLGFRVVPPEGAYYVLADFSEIFDGDDWEFARFMVRDGGVAGVPGSSFYHDPRHGAHQIRFSFAPSLETIVKAIERMEKRIKTRRT